MIHKKRGNIFETLDQETDDDSAEKTSQNSRQTEGDGSQFQDLKHRLEGIYKDSSEVMKTLRVLRSQVEEIKDYFEGNFDEAGEVFDIDEKYFRLADINPNDEGQNLFEDYEGSEQLCIETREIAKASRRLMQIIL